MSKLIVTGRGGELLVDRRLDDGVAALLDQFVQDYNSSKATDFERVRGLSLSQWLEAINAELRGIVGESLTEDAAYRLRQVAGLCFACIETHLRSAQS